ncbi:MAG: rhomboid family intramembrane serine protease [candidate division Zixibacteria bacterium]|nr:rhomboid family intramembrane serine protease [candidate division Zixibacteria bacterium]
MPALRDDWQPTRSPNPWGRGLLPPAVRALITANVAVFVVQLFLDAPMVRFGGLSPVLVVHGAIWQLFTYMFLHGGLLHLAFNMLGLWMFGRDLEHDWGSRAFLKYYLVCGLGAGVVTLAALWGQTAPTIGASGAIYGVLLAFGMTYPDRYIYLWFFLPIKAKYMVMLFGAMELISSLQYSPDGIGHFTHLGGLAVGFLYLKFGVGDRPVRFPRPLAWMGQWRARHRAHLLRRRWDEHRELMDAVDRVLDRINQVGYDNLTDEEKATLERASRRLTSESQK